MAPRSEHIPSGITSKPLPASDDVIFISVFQWLERKKAREGAEGLWRIHDKLYDFTKFIDHHPGGKYWLEVTKGTDITESFESIHLTEKAEGLLKKYYVRAARTPRYSLLTFHESGFYRTLKRKIRERKLLDKDSLGPQTKTKLLADGLAFMVFATGLLGTAHSFGFLVISGILLSLLTVCAHNFFHMKDNWRMYYFSLSLLAVRDWRISHVMSHHNYPNTNLDLEVKMVEPLWNFLPREDKKFGKLSWILTPFLLTFLTPAQFVQRLIGLALKQHRFHSEEFIPFSLLFFLIVFSGQSVFTSFVAWSIIILCGSFSFAFIGFTAAHHHPDIYHDGDFLGNDKDFGVLQLAAVRGREEVDGNFFLTLVTFGAHALHHLFPSIDHSKLPLLNDVFEETCKEFNLNFKPVKSASLVVGMFQQLKRNYVNKKLKIFR